MNQDLKELFETPAAKRMLAILALITLLAFVDDVVMIVSFLLDGAYWAAAGRITVFVLVGGTVALLWRSASRYMATVGATAEEMSKADLHVVCEKHPPFGKVEQLGGVCMVCRFEDLDLRIADLEAVSDIDAPKRLKRIGRKPGEAR